MKLTTATAVLLAGAAVAGVGAARLVQEQRHQRERHQAALTRNQLDWLTATTSNADLAKLWMPDDVSDAEEYQQLLHANHQLCALSLRHQLGFVDDVRLRLYATALMEHEVVRRYWRRFGAFRAVEAAGDESAEQFTNALEAAARAHAATVPTAA
ncbi:DUF6082 family protein [Streptomyces sp. NPDC020412]|uniref:DUF6082 family protein n=1 Tax=Streptomyces sp. NPDC020412 TaxID=3365073 RepID=UPI003788E6C4